MTIKSQVEYPLLGLQRLARVVDASLKIQNLTYRDVEKLSAQVYGEANTLRGRTILAYRKGRIKTPQRHQLQKLAFFCFQVEKFVVTPGDKIGIPVFKHWGRVNFVTGGLDGEVGFTDVDTISDRYWDGQEIDRLESKRFSKLWHAQDKKQFPDWDLRYHGEGLLKDISLNRNLTIEQR
jgi:hypothetical protein